MHIVEDYLMTRLSIVLLDDAVAYKNWSILAKVIAKVTMAFFLKQCTTCNNHNLGQNYFKKVQEVKTYLHFH